MPIYMNYDGIPGESQAKDHEKWIELLAFGWGESRGLNSGQGGTVRESGTVQMSDVNIIKYVDSSSPKLFTAGATGTLDKIVKIDFVRTAKGVEQTYMQYTLEGVGVSSFSVSGGGEDRPRETISLNYDKIEFKYNAIGDDLTGNPETVFYNLATKESG